MTSLASAFVELGKKQAQTFKKYPEDYLELLVTAPSQRSVLNSVYRILCQREGFKPIEDLPEENRRELWAAAKKLAAGRLDTYKTVLLCRCLYTLEWLMNM
jgi:hypothetical protein